MIWSVVGRPSVLPLPVWVRKDGCGGMLRARRVRAAVDFWRVPPGGRVVVRASRVEVGAEDAARRQQATAGLVAKASIVI